MADRIRCVVVGAGGRLGAALCRSYERDFDLITFTHAQLDIGKLEGLRKQLEAETFDVLINCAAQTNVDRCETEREEAYRLNGDAPRVMAEACSNKGARLLHVSTDYVFAGERQEPYSEEDDPDPVSIYGDSKYAGEKNVGAVDPRHLIARVSWVFGPDRPSFIDAIIKRALSETTVEAIGDKWAAPSYTVDLAGMFRDLLLTEAAAGIFHLTNSGACTWQEYGQWALDCCAREGVPLKATQVEPLKIAEMKNFVARRPVFSVLGTSRYTQFTGKSPRPWREAVADYVRSYVAR